jgi:hypothetical protein
LYPLNQPPNCERLSQSIEECGTSYYKTNTNNHFSGNQDPISTLTTDQQKSRTTTIKDRNIADSRQNLSRRKERRAYKSETHQSLHSFYRTLPHHTVPERQNQENHDYQSSRHHQYNAVALLLLKRNNFNHSWLQPAQQRLLSPLNPHRLVELSTLSLRQIVEEPPALAGLWLKNESRPDSSPPYDAAEEEAIHREAVEAAEAAEAVEEAEEHQLLRSPRPRLKQLFPKQLTSEQWGPPQEYSKEIEPKLRTSSMNYGTITASTEELPGLTPL